MKRFMVFGIIALLIIMTTWASYAGWGLDKPRKEQKTVRQGSTHSHYHSRGFYFIGRGHSNYGGK